MPTVGSLERRDAVRSAQDIAILSEQLRSARGGNAEFLEPVRLAQRDVLLRENQQTGHVCFLPRQRVGG